MNPGERFKKKKKKNELLLIIVHLTINRLLCQG